MFWADKVVSLSGGAAADVYWLAQTYYLTKQYHRAIVLLTSHKLLRVMSYYGFIQLLAYLCGEK